MRSLALSGNSYIVPLEPFDRYVRFSEPSQTGSNYPIMGALAFVTQAAMSWVRLDTRRTLGPCNLPEVSPYDRVQWDQRR
jgi:hypothetical protein